MARSVRVVVGPEQAGWRLDAVIASCGEVSRTKARALLAAGSVFVDRRRVRVASRALRPGQVVEVQVVSLEPAGGEGLELLYLDRELVVVNKPAGVPVQPTRARADIALTERLKCQLALRELPRVVHRLDQAVSGAVVLALTPTAAAGLSAQLAAHDARRTYVAFCEGADPAAQTLRHFLTPLRVPPRDEEGRGGLARVEVREARGGARGDEQLAISHLEVEAGCGGCSGRHSRVRVRLETGRTHQIRAQLAASGHPLVGDVRYGASGGFPGARGERVGLHAVQLCLIHPVLGTELEIQAPLAADLEGWWEQHGREQVNPF